MLTKEEQCKADEKFRSLAALYKDDKDPSIWAEMWMLVQCASESAVKSMLKGVKVPDLEELIVDTTIGAMNKIKKEFNNNNEFILENKLVTFCRSYALYPLYKPSKKFNEKAISYESYLETHADNIAEDGLTNKE